MADSKTEAITQADFTLFKQEMKADFTLFKQEMKADFNLFKDDISNKFELYLSQIDSKTEAMINKRVDKIGKWVIGLGTLFVLAFFTYFEVMRTKVDQVNSERIALMENIVYASQAEIRKQEDNKQYHLSKDKKTKKIKK